MPQLIAADVVRRLRAEGIGDDEICLFFGTEFMVRLGSISPERRRLICAVINGVCPDIVLVTQLG